MVSARDGSPAALRQIDVRAGTEQIILFTAHCTVVAVDIVGFGEHHRNNINQVRVRHGMYRAMQDAFESTGIPWDACHREDRGDGMLILAPADVSKGLFVDRLPDELVAALAGHNRVHPAEEKIRLRLALHAGEVNYDEHGVTGFAVTHTFRILDADTVKDALARSTAVLAVVGSDWFYDEVIRNSERSGAKAYEPVDVTNKETAARAWIRLLRRRSVRAVRSR